MKNEKTLKRLIRRDWELWGLTIGILLVCALFIILTQFYWEPSEIGLREYTVNATLLGFTALTLLFCAYIIFTEARTKKLQKEKAEEQVKAIKITAEVFDDIMDIIFVVADLDGKIIYINKAVETYGFKTSEFIGKRPDEPLFLAESEIPKVMRAIEETKGRGIVKNIELTAVTKDKKEFPAMINFSLMKATKGIPIGIIGSIRDITELKCLQEKEKAVAADKVRVEEAEKFTKELQEKVKELEEFHYLAVGRELKMIELKKEMEELKKR